MYWSLPTLLTSRSFSSRNNLRISRSSMRIVSKTKTACELVFRPHLNKNGKYPCSMTQSSCRTSKSSPWQPTLLQWRNQYPLLTQAVSVVAASAATRRIFTAISRSYAFSTYIQIPNGLNLLFSDTWSPYLLFIPTNHSIVSIVCV